MRDFRFSPRLKIEDEKKVLLFIKYFIEKTHYLKSFSKSFLVSSSVN